MQTRPVTQATAGRSNGAASARIQSGSTRTSSSVYATTSPVAADRPQLRARDRPGTDSRTYRKRTSSPTVSRKQRNVLSSDGALSTMTISSAG